MTTTDSYAAAAQAEVRRVRRELGAKTPEVFASIYLAAHFQQKISTFHWNFFGELEDIVSKRGSRLAVAAPRGHAKSTVLSLAYALWCLLYGHEKLVLIISNTAEQAGKLLRHIKQEVETNRLLAEDFPGLAAAQKLTPWRKDSLLLPNGAMVLSYGAGQNLRGARHRQYRPSLIIADVLDDHCKPTRTLDRGESIAVSRRDHSRAVGKGRLPAQSPTP